MLTAIAEINRAVDTGSAGSVLEKLKSPDSCIGAIEESFKEKYFSSLLEEKLEKAKVSHSKKVLVHVTVLSCFFSFFVMFTCFGNQKIGFVTTLKVEE